MMSTESADLETVNNNNNINNRSTHDQDLAWGSGLAIFGNVLISGSLNLQRGIWKMFSSLDILGIPKEGSNFFHSWVKDGKNKKPASIEPKHKKPARQNREIETQKHYTKDPLWWLGLCLMILGEGCNFTAYGFAPASLVAPLGTTTVIANLLIAALVLKEKVKGENLFGCALAIIAAFMLVTFSGEDEKIQGSYEIIESLSQPVFVGYVFVEITAVASLLVMLHYYNHTHVVVYLLISSITASFTVISAKAVSGMLLLSLSGFSQWTKPILYAMLLVLIITALIQIKYLNLAMKHYDSTMVVPINFVIFTASAILAGIVFYKEFLGMTDLEIVMFLFGCVLSFMSVYFITLVKKDKLSGKLVEQHVSTDLIPSWMVADVNVGQVQPQGHVDHLKTLAGKSGGAAYGGTASGGADEDAEGDDVCAPLHAKAPRPVDSPALDSGRTEQGAVGGVSADQLSLSSMDMLLDRERMDNYGATVCWEGGRGTT